MEPGGSIPHSQGFYDTYLFLSILIMPSHIRLGLHNGVLPVGSPVKMLKTLLQSTILATLPARLNLDSTNTRFNLLIRS